MRQMEQFAAVPLGTLAVPGDVHRVSPLTGDRWLVDCRATTSGDSHTDQHELVVVNALLQPVWRLQVPAGVLGWFGAHAVSDDLSMAAVALPREVRLLDHTGELVESFRYGNQGDAGSAPGEAGGCAFSSDGRQLWVCAPWFGEHNEQRDEVWLIDLAARQVLDRRPVGAASQWMQFHRHPDGQTVALRRAYTLEEPTVWARSVDNRMDLHLPRADTVLADIHPAGREYLATSVQEEDPSRGVPSVLARYRHPDHAPLERLPAAGALPLGYGWTNPAYLTEQLLLATTWSSAGDPAADLLVRRAPLAVLGAVRYPGGAGRRPGPLSTCHAGRWLTVSDGMVQAWALADPHGFPGVLSRTARHLAQRRLAAGPERQLTAIARTSQLASRFRPAEAASTPPPARLTGQMTSPGRSRAR